MKKLTVMKPSPFCNKMTTLSDGRHFESSKSGKKPQTFWLHGGKRRHGMPTQLEKTGSPCSIKWHFSADSTNY